MSKEKIDYIVENTTSHSATSFETRFRKIFSGDSYKSGFTKVLEQKTEEEISLIQQAIWEFVRLSNELKDTKKKLREADKVQIKLHNEAKRNKNTVDSLNFMIHQLHPVGDEY